MKIVLHCEPNTAPLTWEDFLKQAPDRSVAIDGYVIGAPKFDGGRLIMNVNHHEGVDRFSTRCTCAQLAMQIRTGLFQAFPGNEPVHVFFNDCDQDVCLSIWLLRNGMISRNIVNPILNRLLFIEDMLDTTAGAYGFPTDMSALLENNWIFAPYVMARQNGALGRRSAEEFIQVIDAVEARINQAIVGNGKKLDLDTKYEVLLHKRTWAVIREIGLNARTGMFADGIRAFVSVQERMDGRMKYSIGRSGIWIPFDIPLILSRLNELEADPVNKWGGGDTIGGSPRATGSRLTINEVVEAIEKTLT
jgi:hypothetical protein